MVPARNLVGRFRAHHRTGSVPSSRLLATKALFLKKDSCPQPGMLRTLEIRRPSRPLSGSPVSTASRRKFLAVLSESLAESLPSRLLRRAWLRSPRSRVGVPSLVSSGIERAFVLYHAGLLANFLSPRFQGELQI